MNIILISRNKTGTLILFNRHIDLYKMYSQICNLKNINFRCDHLGSAIMTEIFTTVACI